MLRPGPRGPKVLRHQMVPYSDVPGARSTRDGDTGNEDNSSFAQFFKLDKYAMFSFAMTCGLASNSDKFKIIINAALGAKIWRYGTLQKFQFFV